MDFYANPPCRLVVLESQKIYFMFKNISKLSLAGVLVLLTCQMAEAQAPLGVRAQGMAGAFVGVADDASAVYWNPAGLATGAFVSFVLDYGRTETVPGLDRDPLGGDRQTGGMVSLTLSPAGIAYYRQGLLVAGPREAEAPGPSGREEVVRSVQALVTSTLGAAVLQSIGDYFVVGATLKLMRGEVGSGLSDAVSAAQALDAAGAMDRRSSTTGDVDLGVMAALDRFRIGVVARNLTTPAFEAGDAGEVVELEREVRVGGAWASGWPGISRVIVAVDGDVLTRESVSGDRRDLAAGVETWWLGRRFGARGGVRTSTLGEARPVVTGGVSAGVTPAAFIEAHVAYGQDESRGWSVGARFTF